MHKININQTRPVIDNSEPFSLKYPIVKTKKELIIEGKLLFFKLFLTELYIERCTEIEKANRLLLEKMASIMSA